MIDLWTLYKYLRWIVNQSQSGFKLTPEYYQINLVFANFELFKREYGLTEEFKPGMPFSKSAYELVQQNKDKLSRFLVIMGDVNAPLFIDQYGQAQLPSDYLHVSSIVKYTYTNNPDCTITEDGGIVEIMQDNRFVFRKFSQIRPPSVRPICKFMDGYIRFEPKAMASVEFSYLRKPVTPVFAYTLDAMNNPLPDTASMVEMEWDEQGYIDIGNIILSKIGINQQRADVTQYAELIKTKGL